MRVKRGNVNVKRHKKILKLAKGLSVQEAESSKLLTALL